VTIDVVSIKPVNELNGQSRVTDIRIYQLKDNAKFDNANIDDLWSNDKEVLGDTLLGEPKTGESLFPEDRNNAQGKKIEIELESQTAYIGILALYSESDEVGKQFVSVPLDKADDVVFELTGYHIAIKE
jgi:type VI secretion system VasD/TssJ family lipoprotein